LTHLVANPQLPVHSLPLTTLSERTALIASSAGPVVDLDLQAPELFNLPSLFAAQVAKSPSATALVYESASGSIEQLTYAQLDEQA
ncbi:hypothetical protein ICN41_11255, partial [Polynucleobacter sp. 15G-AUS-farblos]|nr:hypothetical protein [Polynucleobacter sp. 15G-AUS-farblos]